ncbi:unnamed protein product [Nyctereutes procyonoides]|uniref:(raccoon dog) hypothetical protein n=1 Tax=Nyctereutes procyonoides TaxID=34880 RepID=A0A811ZTC3_NYCPR|nr:unnamed protein product [Nyctereutes procyonoides]
MSSKRAKAKTTKKRPQRATSNVFTMFDQSQIQEFKEEDLHDMLASLGFIHEDHLRELLTTMGDCFMDKEVDEMYREAPIDKKGNFNYVEFTHILKHGAKDKDD